MSTGFRSEFSIWWWGKKGGGNYNRKHLSEETF